MTYLAVGDIHIDENGRLDDLKKVLDQIVVIVESENVDKVLFLGDAFTSRRPTSMEYGVMCEWVSALVRKKKYVILLRGNHDQQRDVSTLDIFENLKVGPDDLLSKYVRVVDTNYIENGIFLGHFVIKEAVLGSSGFHLDSAVTVDQLITRYPEVKLFLMGDIHKPQQVWQNPPIYYVGSVDRNNFGERANDPRVLLVNGDDYSVESVPLSVRPMVQLEVEASELSEACKDDSRYASGERTFEPRLKGAIVKLVVAGTEDDLSRVDMSVVREMFKHAHSLSVHQEPIKAGVVRDADTTSSMSDSDLLLKYVRDKRSDLSEEICVSIINLGHGIVEKVGLSHK